ncbi:MAG: hypothetical protein SNH27_09795 [Rikenellaceae bacterium]
MMDENLDMMMVRIDDRFDRLESMLRNLVEVKVSKPNFDLYDNCDLMKITKLSYSALAKLRHKQLLSPLNRFGKNFYTEVEVHRFIREVLPDLERLNAR